MVHGSGKTTRRSFLAGAASVAAIPFLAPLGDSVPISHAPAPDADDPMSAADILDGAMVVADVPAYEAWLNLPQMLVAAEQDYGPDPLRQAHAVACIGRLFGRQAMGNAVVTPENLRDLTPFRGTIERDPLSLKCNACERPGWWIDSRDGFWCEKHANPDDDEWYDWFPMGCCVMIDKGVVRLDVMRAVLAEAHYRVDFSI